MRRLAILLLVAPGVALGQVPGGSPDGRLLGHIPYPEADPATLADAPAGFAIGQRCRVQAAMLPDLQQLVAAEAAAVPDQRIGGLSCFRSVARQESIFCRGRRGCGDAERRALSVGPPGHSEHATGYAIDFGVRGGRGCRDIDPCIADTPAGQWLLANGARYGFELSFPQANVQGVMWEPWHWRWVGATQEVAGAAAARALFARARTDFPAHPAEIGFAIRLTSQPPLPAGSSPP